MSDPTFGISITPVDAEARPAITANMSVVGLVGTAPNANATTFPLNEPVTFFSDDEDMLAALGTSGTLYDAIAAINEQLGAFQVAAQVVVVRVAVGNSTAQTIANLRGDINAKTGMYALRNSGTLLGVTPRLIAVPGYTSQAANGISAATITNRGTGYTSAPSVGFSGGGGSGAAALATLSQGVTSITVADDGQDYTTAPTVTIGAPDLPGGIQATATATVGSGAVTEITVSNPGKGYSQPPTVTLSGGGGTGGAAIAVLGGVLDTVTITDPGMGYTSAPTLTFTGGGGTGAAATAVRDTTTNAIIAGLPPLLDSLLAVAVVDGPSSTMTDAINWRESISSRRIIPVDPAVKKMDADGSTAIVPFSPYVLGVAVRRDHEKGGRPFHSWANQPVAGIVGAARPIDFSILDGATEGQTLLSHNIGVLVRGESTDGAIADGGYVYVGTDTASDDTLWRFYNQVRGRDYIHLIFIKTLRFYLGKFNITGQTIQAVLNTMQFALRDLQADQDILGFKVGFNRDQNSPEQLRLGRFTVMFAAEEAPVLRHLGIQSARYRPALDTLLNDLLKSVDVNA